MNAQETQGLQEGHQRGARDHQDALTLAGDHQRLTDGLPEDHPRDLSGVKNAPPEKHQGLEARRHQQLQVALMKNLVVSPGRLKSFQEPTQW